MTNLLPTVFSTSADRTREPRPRLAKGLTFVCTFLFGLPAVGIGQTVWTGATGDWFTATNWSSGVPTSTSDAQINNGGTAQINASGAVARSVILGYDTPDLGNLTSSGSASLSLSSDLSVGYGGSGTLGITSGATVSDTSGEIGYTILSGTGANGVATVDGAGSTWNNSFELYVGYGTGTLDITNGATVSDFYGYLGYYPEFPGRSSGTATIDGAGSTWNNGADLHVGDSGTGVLNITNGGAVTNGTGSLGYNFGADGTATIDGAGSNWSNGGFFYVGNGGNGTLTVTNGGQVSSTSSFAYIAYDASSESTATIDGVGSAWSNTGGLYVGFSGAGSLSISNGGSVTNGTFANVGFSVGATGNLIVSGAGSSFTTDGVLSIGGNVSGPGGTGLLHVNDGGSVSAASATIWGPGTLEIGGTPSLTIPTLTFDGGTFRAVADSTFPNDAVLGANGATFDSNGFTVTLSGVWSGAGTVTKNGTGTVILGGANTYAGDTTIAGGTFLARTRRGSATGSGAVFVSAGTFGGTGRIGGPVTVGTGSGFAAFLAPGVHGPGNLSIQKTVTFNADATFQVELQTRNATADSLIARQVMIDGKARFAFTSLGHNVLAAGSVFTLISNTGAQPIAGTFSNLADGSTLTANGNTFQASYEGGDGNDLTLTVIP